MKKVILTVLTLATIFVGCNKDEIAGLESDLAKERLYNRGYQNEVNKILQELAASQEALTAAEGDITMLNAVISTANAQINELDGTVADQAAAISDLNDVIDSAEAQIADLEADLEVANDSIAELTASISTLEKLVQALRNSQVVNVIEVVEVIQQVTEVVGFTQAEVEAAVAAGGTVSQDDIDTAVEAAIGVALTNAETARANAQGDADALRALLNSVKDLRSEFATADSDLVSAIDTFITNLEASLADGSDDFWTYTDWVGDAPAAQTSVTTTTAASDVATIDQTTTTSVAAYNQTRTASLTIIGDVADVDAPIQESLTRTIPAESNPVTIQIANPIYVAPVSNGADTYTLGDWTILDAAWDALLANGGSNGGASATYEVTRTRDFTINVVDAADAVAPVPTEDLTESQTIADTDFVAPPTGDVKDLDNDGDVDYADAVLAGYEVVSVGGSPGGWNVEYNASAISDLGLVNTLVSNQTIGQYNLSFDTVDAAIAQKYAEDQIKDAYIAL